MPWDEIQLQQPWLLALAALLPLGLWLAHRRVRHGALRFSSLQPFRGLRPSLRVRLRFLPALLRLLALALLIVALARPQRGTALSPERARGIGILLAIDCSSSMLADDFVLEGRKVTRIEAVKHVAKRFIEGGEGLAGRPNDEIGLLSFSGYPVPRAPLTLDHGAVIDVLESLEAPDPRKMPTDNRGRPLYPEELSTAIGDALAKGSEELRDVQVKSKVMILLTDGAQTMGTLEPLEGAKIAQSFGIKVYAIGVGQAGWVLRTVESLFGPVQQRVKSDLDEPTMQAIAAATGGKYFNAASTEALLEVYREIDALERSEIETHRFYRWDERFQSLALAALGLVLVEVLLAQTLFRRVP